MREVANELTYKGRGDIFAPTTSYPVPNFSPTL